MFASGFIGVRQKAGGYMLIGYYRSFFGEDRNFYDELKNQNCDVILADRENELFEWKKVLRLLKKSEEGEPTLIIPSIKVLGFSIQSLSDNLVELLRIPNKIIVLDRKKGIQNLAFTEVSEIASGYMGSSIARAQDRNRKQYRGWVTKPPYGYKVVDRELAPNEDEWDIARDIIQIYRSDRTFRGTIAKINAKYPIDKYPHAREWSTTTLRVWLAYPSLRGHTRHKSKSGSESIRFNTHQALLSLEESADIDDLIKESKRKWNQNAKKADIEYPLKGLIFCGACGSACYRSTSSDESMRCRRRDENTALCPNKKSTPFKLIENAVIDLIREKVPGFVDFYVAATQKPISEDDNEDIKNFKNQIAGLRLLQHQYGDRNNILKDAIAQLDFEVQNERQKVLVSLGTQRELMTFLGSPSARSAQFWRNLPAEEKKTAFDALVEKVIIQDGGVKEVVLKF